MNSLFLKVFLSFWLITIAVILSTHLALSTLPVSEQSNTLQTRELSRLAAGVLTRAQQMADGPQPDMALQQWLQQLPQDQQIQSFYQLAGTDPASVDSTDPRVAEALAALDLAAPEFYRKDEERVYQGRLLLHNDVPLAKLLIVTPVTSSLDELRNRTIWLRLIVSITVSGVMCLIMSYVITRPILALRAATAALAEGNLGARYQGNTRGSDAIAQLGSGFNLMATRLQQTIEEQKQLVRDISHELRSPLARIQTALALAQHKYGDDSTELSRVEKECNRLNALIGQLLVVPDNKPPLSDCIDLVGLLRDIAEDDRLQAQQQQTSIELHSSDAELLLRTSGNLLWHAVENCLRNALRFAPPGSTITLSLRHDSARHCVEIGVRDRGPGVSEDLLETIFHPFFRADSARDHGPGYGLGLSIARRAVQAHGGVIRAVNRQPGLEILIELPDSLLAAG